MDTQAENQVVFGVRIINMYNVEQEFTFDLKHLRDRWIARNKFLWRDYLVYTKEIKHYE